MVSLLNLGRLGAVVPELPSKISLQGPHGFDNQEFLAILISLIIIKHKSKLAVSHAAGTDSTIWKLNLEALVGIQIL